MIVTILLISVLFAFFAISYRLNKKTPYPEGFERKTCKTCTEDCPSRECC